MFSDAEEVPSVVSPFDVEKSLAKIFPQIASLITDHCRTLTRPSTLSTKATSLLEKFHRELEQEKADYDQQLHHVAMEFIDFYAKNFRDDSGDTANRRRELQMSFGLIVSAIALGEMSITQFASQPDIVLSIIQRLQKVEDVKDQYQDAGWLDHLRDMITSLGSVFSDILCDNEGDTSRFNNHDSLDSDGLYEKKNFVAEPVEGAVALLSPSELTQANEMVQEFANGLLVRGSVVLDLSQTGHIMSVTGEWRELLGLVLHVVISSAYQFLFCL